MSALPPKADEAQTCWHVRFVPKADIRIAAKQHLYSITSSVRAGSLEIDDQFEFGWFLYPVPQGSLPARLRGCDRPS
jgi:hypothetical protein